LFGHECVDVRRLQQHIQQSPRYLWTGKIRRKIVSFGDVPECLIHSLATCRDISRLGGSQFDFFSHLSTPDLIRDKDDVRFGYLAALFADSSLTTALAWKADIGLEKDSHTMKSDYEDAQAAFAVTFRDFVLLIP
jgi:hypothetical protein